MPLILNGTTGVSGVDGSAGTPSYQGGDTNTGIFYPAADTIAFAEGGVEVARFDSSGNLGIGTSSPVGKLQIAQTNNTTINGGSYLNLGKSENGVGGYRLIGMGYNPSSNFAPAYMGYVETDNNAGTAGSLVYFTRPSGSADTVAPTERMRIDSSGRVGIGVTPSAWGSGNSVLDIGASGALLGSNTGAGVVDLYYNNFFNGSNSIYKATGFASYYRQNTGDHIWYTAPSGTAGATITFTERMRITSGGDLQFNSGYGSVATAYGCRAWVNFNGTGTPAIRASGNVTSITDNGTGDYTVNLTTAMPDINYAPVISNSKSPDIDFVGINTNTSTGGDVAPTTTTCRISFSQFGVGGKDPTYISFAIFR